MSNRTLLQRLEGLRTSLEQMRDAGLVLITAPDLVAEVVAAAELDGWPDTEGEVPNPFADRATVNDEPFHARQGPGPLTTRPCDWVGCTATLVAIDLDRLRLRPSPSLQDLADRQVVATDGGQSDPPPALCAHHRQLEATRHPAFSRREWELLVPADRPAAISQRLNESNDDASGHAFLQLRSGDEVWSDDIRDELEGNL